MVLIAALLLVALLLSSTKLQRVIPSETIAAVLLVGVGVVMLFQMGELN